MTLRAICTRADLSKPGSVEAPIRMLKSTIGDRIPFGIELFCSVASCLYRDEQIVENAKLARKRGAQVILMHAPISRSFYQFAPTNLAKPDWNLLHKICRLAWKVGADLMTFHGEVFRTSAEMRSMTRTRKTALAQQVGENLADLSRLSRVKIGVENMPKPLLGDKVLSANEMIFDPLFADAWELAQFCREYGLRMSLNTANFGARPTVSSGSQLLPAFRTNRGLIDNISLSDTSGQWKDGVSTFTKGLVPGEGKLGKYLDELMRSIKHGSTSHTVTLEVVNSDSVRLKESKKGMTWLIHALLG